MIGGLFGEDRDGHPVWYDPYGCLDTKGIFYSTTRHDFLKYKIVACETIQKAVDGCNAKVSIDHDAFRTFRIPSVAGGQRSNEVSRGQTMKTFQTYQNNVSWD